MAKLKASFDLLKILQAEFGEGFETSLKGRAKFYTSSKISASGTILKFGEANLIAETEFSATSSTILIEGISNFNADTELIATDSTILIKSNADFNADTRLAVRIIIDGVADVTADTKLNGVAKVEQTFFIQGSAFASREERI